MEKAGIAPDEYDVEGDTYDRQETDVSTNKKDVMHTTRSDTKSDAAEVDTKFGVRDEHICKLPIDFSVNPCDTGSDTTPSMEEPALATFGETVRAAKIVTYCTKDSSEAIDTCESDGKEAVYRHLERFDNLTQVHESTSLAPQTSTMKHNVSSASDEEFCGDTYGSIEDDILDDHSDDDNDSSLDSTRKHLAAKIGRVSENEFNFTANLAAMAAAKSQKLGLNMQSFSGEGELIGDTSTDEGDNEEETGNQ